MACGIYSTVQLNNCSNHESLSVHCEEGCKKWTVASAWPTDRALENLGWGTTHWASHSKFLSGSTCLTERTMNKKAFWASFSGEFPWKGLGTKDHSSWEILSFLSSHSLYLCTSWVSGSYPMTALWVALTFRRSTRRWRVVWRRDGWHWCVCYTDPQEVSTYQETVPRQYHESAFAYESAALGLEMWPFQFSISSSHSRRERNHLCGFPVGCITVYIPLELLQFLDMGEMGNSPSEAETHISWNYHEGVLNPLRIHFQGFLV